MTVKLNLTIEEQLVKKVKAYAQKRKVSVSKLVEQLLTNEIKPFDDKNSLLERYAGVLDGKLSDEMVEETLATKNQKYGY
jgi:metal-responsive CopG/Arc/MetJ family transcriptional regulator